MSSAFLTAEWRNLIMAQYVVEPCVLAPWLPEGLELDLFVNGTEAPRCFVSLVGFLFARVRLRGISIPFHTTFEEINLRFYVRRIDPDGTIRRGVVFIREFVPRAAISVVANLLYEEPYAISRTRRSFTQDSDSQSVEYAWNRGSRWYSLAVQASLQPQPILPSSLEEFITEHYWGFTRRRRGFTSQYEVAHPRWQTFPIRSYSIKTDFGALYGPAFAHLNIQQPHNVLLAEGSPVTVLSGSRLPRR